MKTAALIVTTGLPGVSGVAALTADVGAISAGQRMISAFQRAGVSLVGLVVGPEDKKAERQFAQNGVVFLRCEDEASDFFRGLKLGLSFLRGKFQRVLLVPGDMPLFLPATVEAMLSSTASIVVPEYKHLSGYPVLLDEHAMDAVLAAQDLAEAQESVTHAPLCIESVCVEDSGILIRDRDMSHRQTLIHNHNSQLSRPIAEVSICNGIPLYDSRMSMLLHLVEDTHSVQEACSLMQISYSTAWKMLNHVEESLGFPLIVRNRGGSSGNGTVLTDKGRQLMDAYDRFSERLNQQAQQLYRQMFDPSEWN